MSGAPAGGPFRLYAIRYATNPRRRAPSNFLSNADIHDGPMPMDYFVWLARNDHHAVLVDGGMDAQACQARGHTYLHSPPLALRRLGVEPEHVGALIVTHMHWDHAGNLDAFPNARLYVHPRELAHACGPDMAHAALRRPYHIGQVCSLLHALYQDRVAFCGDAMEIVPGISVHHVGGHTPGMQVVRVQTVRGPVVLASDAAHYTANLVRRNPFPILTDTIAYVRAWETLRALAGDTSRIVPGHDPEVMARYPDALPGEPGLAVRLDLPPAPAEAA